MRKFLESLGQVCAVIGAQWGDEGKGKIVDILGEHFDVVARACGGANAGHTIYVNRKKHVFHLLPASSLHQKPVMLGAGMVIHLPTLLEEIRTLQGAGVEVLPRLHLSASAHIVWEFERAIDAVMEDRRAQKAGGKIGTTKRGIGPAYASKAFRSGLRLECLLWEEKRVRGALTAQAEDVHAAYGVQVDIDAEIDMWKQGRDVLHPRVTATLPKYLSDLLKEGKTLLIEGAQATLLDIDHGTYPYVTSSSTTAAGALQGLGIPPRVLTSCIGVAKAYCTRVGEGYFATEVLGPTGDRLRERGGEYGATTGRPRRCGWLSLPDLRYAAMLNGFTHLNITKLDVLDEEENIPVATATNADGTVEFKAMRGWKTSTAGIKTFIELPEAAKEFIKHIEEQTHIPVAVIGTGQGRDDIIIAPDLHPT